MTTFVLVHGAWHDGAAWQATCAHLQAAGHRTYAPTLAGHGLGVDKRVTHADCTRSLADFIVEHDLRDFVLVGHSFAGTIIAKLAEIMPERIRRLVFWNAFVLQHGESLMDNVPPHYREMFEHLVTAERTVMLPFTVWRDAFMNDASLELAQTTYATLSPEPYQPFIDQLDLQRFFTQEIPRSYLNCTEDTALPPGEWGWHPRMSNRLGVYRLVQMAGGHEVLFTNPAGLAAKLIEAARD
ncbi:MAG: alpha/beta hydrolase [Gammaproteobacteria bacterium]|nr:alpha/beta hydrolase [Gammaproteobacteria bacterium]